MKSNEGERRKAQFEEKLRAAIRNMRAANTALKALQGEAEGNALWLESLTRIAMGPGEATMQALQMMSEVVHHVHWENVEPRKKRAA